MEVPVIFSSRSDSYYVIEVEECNNKKNSSKYVKTQQYYVIIGILVW